MAWLGMTDEENNLKKAQAKAAETQWVSVLGRELAVLLKDGEMHVQFWNMNRNFSIP